MTPSDPPRVRPLERDEFPAACRLLAHLNPETPLDVVSSRLATMSAEHPHYQLYGVFVNGALAGVAGAWIGTRIWCGRYLEIDNLVVDPELRSSGAGTALIRHLEALGHERGCSVLVMDSYAGNRASHRLYHRLGFEIWSFHFIKPIGDWKAGATP